MQTLAWLACTCLLPPLQYLSHFCVLCLDLPHHHTATTPCCAFFAMPACVTFTHSSQIRHGNQGDQNLLRQTSQMEAGNQLGTWLCTGSLHTTMHTHCSSPRASKNAYTAWHACLGGGAVTRFTFCILFCACNMLHSITGNMLVRCLTNTSHPPQMTTNMHVYVSTLRW